MIGTSAPTKTVEVLVIQPHMLMRQGMVGMLQSSDNLDVVADTGSLDEGIRLAQQLQPDVVVVDIDVPEPDGARTVTTLKQQLQGGRVLVIAERAGQAQVERALAAGADGYTLKATSLTEFVDTVRSVSGGELVLHPAVASTLARSFSSLSNGNRSGSAILTPRQREIVELMVQGLQNKQIARRLDIGVETVKTHISRILDRLGVSSRTEAVVIALRDGLVA